VAKVSVIVPTRARPHLVGRAVESILRQTFSDFEIVLIDNNPIEESIVRVLPGSWWLSDPRVRLLHDERPRNAAQARNSGLAIARGVWITYLDDDDTYHPRKLELQLAAAESSGLPLGLCGMARHVSCRRRPMTWNGQEISGDNLLLYFSGTPTLFHRQTRDCNFDGSMDAGEDQYFYLKLIRYFGTSRVFNAPGTLVEAYQHRGAHVSLNARAVLQACEACLRDFGSGYSERACKEFRERARLRFYKLDQGHTREIALLCADLMLHHPLRNSRLFLNFALWKIPGVRRWLVN
jgi:glycosyltransferase involved in cell wall biosynthesis